MELNRKLVKEKMQMCRKHLIKCLTSLANREIQIKTTLNFCLTLVRMTIIGIQLMTEAGMVC